MLAVMIGYPVGASDDADGERGEDRRTHPLPNCPRISHAVASGILTAAVKFILGKLFFDRTRLAVSSRLDRPAPKVTGV